MNTRKFIIEKEYDINIIVNYILECNKKPVVVLLKGDLGSGKTTFVRYFANHFGFSNISSPSFNIIHQYNFNDFKVLHIDLFRINDNKSIEELNIYEYIEENDYTFIEWPEYIENDLQDYKHINVEFEIIGKKRRITVQC